MAIYANKGEEEILVTSQNKDNLVGYTFIEKDLNDIDKINLDFENKIKEYNSKYTQEEQKRFADKLRKAEIVLAGGSDYYIETIAEAKGVTPLDIATLIKTKADEFEAFYTQAELDRDTAINTLNNNI